MPQILFLFFFSSPILVVGKVNSSHTLRYLTRSGKISLGSTAIVLRVLIVHIFNCFCLVFRILLFPLLLTFCVFLGLN